MDASTIESKPTKSDVNLVIMDYLISEGYPAAAEKFAEETNIYQGSPVNIEAIKERVKVRNAIFQGNMEEAVDLINELDAEILDQNRPLHFKLMQLQLVELIRPVIQNGASNINVADFKPALQFATQQLAPHAPTDPKHLKALEMTMALMVFKPDKMLPEMKELLDLTTREKVAAEVNKALLLASGRAAEARIKELVRARAWAEAQAREAHITLPEKISIGLDGELTSMDGEAMMT